MSGSTDRAIPYKVWLIEHELWIVLHILVLSMLLKNTCHTWCSSIFQEELKDLYRQGSIWMLLWHKLERFHCSVILVWTSSSVTQGTILPIFIAFLPSDFCCWFCCHSCWFVGFLLSLHSHFMWVPGTRLCDFTFVPSAHVVGQARDALLWGQKSGCRLFIYLLEPGRKWEL